MVGIPSSVQNFVNSAVSAVSSRTPVAVKETAASVVGALFTVAVSFPQAGLSKLTPRVSPVSTSDFRISAVAYLVATAAALFFVRKNLPSFAQVKAAAMDPKATAKAAYERLVARLPDFGAKKPAQGQGSATQV